MLFCILKRWTKPKILFFSFEQHIFTDNNKKASNAKKQTKKPPKLLLEMKDDHWKLLRFNLIIIATFRSILMVLPPETHIICCAKVESALQSSADFPDFLPSAPCRDGGQLCCRFRVTSVMRTWFRLPLRTFTSVPNNSAPLALFPKHAPVFFFPVCFCFFLACYL